MKPNKPTLNDRPATPEPGTPEYRAIYRDRAHRTLHVDSNVLAQVCAQMLARDCNAPYNEVHAVLGILSRATLSITVDLGTGGAQISAALPVEIPGLSNLEPAEGEAPPQEAPRPTPPQQARRRGR